VKNTTNSKVPPTRTNYYWALRVCEQFGWTLDYFDSIDEYQQINLITYITIREIERIEESYELAKVGRVF